MDKVLIAISVIVITIVAFVSGIMVRQSMEQDLEYTVDRIEYDDDGNKYAVVEVYNRTTGEISFIDIMIP